MDTKTLYSKLAAVPPPIKTWLSSDEMVDYVNNIDNQFILPQESSSIIKKLAQRVLIKDIAPEYFSGELAAELKLEKDKAMHISSELKKTIFFPEKAAFSNYGIDIDLLDKFQMPIAKSPLANALGITQNAGPSLSVEISNSTPAPAVLKPSILSDVGWSKASSAGPGITLTAVPATPIPPRAPSISAISIASVPVPQSAAAPAEPAPMMLHEDTNFKAAEKNASFTLSKPGSGAEVHMEKSAAQAPTRPAVLEFGGAKPPTPPSKTSATPASNAMHYTELKLSLSAVPTADTGPRSVNQIVPPSPVPVPKPPASSLQSAVPLPRPPQPPKPPQNNKPIVKDFL
jgi:hypothetical protein